MRLILVMFSLLVIYLSLKYITLFFFPFLVALLSSFMIHPMVTYIEKIKLPRIFATFIVVTIIFVIIGGLSVLILAEIIQGTTYLATEIPTHLQSFFTYVNAFIINKLVPFYEQMTSMLHTLSDAQQIAIHEQIQQLTSQVTTFGTMLLSDFLLNIPALFSMIPYSISMLIFTIIATILITNDWNHLKVICHKVIPSRLKYPSKNLLIHFNQAFIGFLKAQFILISISACITMIGLLLLQIDHTLTITLLIAFVDLLPLFGTGIIFIPWIIYLFIVNNYSLTIGLSLIYMLIVISRQLLEPKILAVNIGVHPLLALLVIFTSLQFWGIFGIVIAPLLIIFIHAIYKSGLLSHIWLFIKGT